MWVGRLPGGSWAAMRWKSTWAGAVAVSCGVIWMAFRPQREVVAKAKGFAQRMGSQVVLTHDPQEAVRGADIIYTDVWTSMGQEKEREERLRAFPPYQVNAQLVAQAGRSPLVMHCLPAHRGEEITDEVIDGPYSIVYTQAENRLHLQKAILLLLMGGS